MRRRWQEILDPSVMDAVFPERRGLWADPEESAEERLLEREEGPEEPPAMGWEAIEPLLRKLPPREQDYVRLYYRDGIKQSQIAAVFGLTQAAVSYRLWKARRRLEFLRVLPDLDLSMFELDLHFLPRQVREVMQGCYETTCQSLVASRLGITQGAARSRYQTGMRALSRRVLRDAEDAAYMARRDGRDAEAVAREAIAAHRLAPYMRAFLLVGEHWNILHEICFPWQRAEVATIITVDDERP